MGARGPVSKAAFGAKKSSPAKGVGEPPTDIPDGAKRYYMALAGELAERLEPEDKHMVARAANALFEIALCNVKLASEGFVVMGSQGETVSAWARVRELADKRFESSAAKLGLSPSDRVRIKATLAEAEPEGGPSAFDAEHGGGSA